MEGKNFENLINEEAAIEKEVREKRNYIYRIKGKMLEAHEKIVDMAEELRNKYPDAEKCYLFHILISSTIDREACTMFDFPGEDSIVKRVNDLYNEYKTE